MAHLLLHGPETLIESVERARVGARPLSRHVRVDQRVLEREADRIEVDEDARASGVDRRHVGGVVELPEDFFEEPQ
eukprot:685830-Prymnesium_polylepis.1